MSPKQTASEQGCEYFFFLKGHHVLLRHHLDRIKHNFGRTSPQKRFEQKHHATFWVKQKTYYANVEFRKFRLVRQMELGPFQFGPIRIFGTSFEGGPL